MIDPEQLKGMSPKDLEMMGLKPSETESPVVGAKKNPDGSMDFSHAMTMSDQGDKHAQTIPESPEASSILDEQEKLSMISELKLQEESVKIRRIRQVAKTKGVEPAQLLQELRDFAKSKIKDPNAKHFHRTDIDSFRQIVEDGALLSRTEVMKLHPERPMSPWSSSGSVMMTRDLERYGLNLGPGRGKGVVFVLGPELIKQDTYDTLSQY